MKLLSVLWTDLDDEDGDGDDGGAKLSVHPVIDVDGNRWWVPVISSLDAMNEATSA